MHATYFPIVLFALVALVLGGMLLCLGHLLAQRQPQKATSDPYECGFPAFADARMPFPVRYHLIAVLFIIFDLETAFLFPWATMFRQLPLIALVSMGIFLGLLILGFYYEWRKGALNWE